MNLTMFDTATASFLTVPGSAEAIAPYMDGDFNNIGAAKARFPHLFEQHRVLSLTCRANDADGVDWEPGNTCPNPASWYAQQHRANRFRPCFYADLSDMKAHIIPSLNSIGLRMGGAGSKRPVRLLTAHPTQVPHICGPKTCGQIGIDMDGTQYWWSSVAHSGADIDISLVREDFFQPTATPPNPHYDWYFKVHEGGKEYDEGAIAKLYDLTRDRSRLFIFAHRSELKSLRATCKLLADRIARVALYDPKTGRKRPDALWDDDHRGFRYQGLIHRSQGRRVA